MQDPVDDIWNYKYGVYYNTDDARIIVPKRSRFLGFTFNFAGGASYLVLSLILVLILLLNFAGRDQ